MTVWFKRTISALAFVLPVSAFAQSIYIYPAAATAPRGSYQTVTAVVTGVNDKTVTWSSDGGTIVGTNPCVVNEPCTVALYTQNTGTYHLTATSNASHTVTASSTLTFTASPTPVTTHPRLMVTSAMLPGLQAKATANNVVYQSIKYAATNYYLNTDSSVWSWTTWNGSACAGPGTGLPSNDQSQNWRENDANLFAYLSMIAPTASERNTWGCYGRDVWVYVMQSIVSGSVDLNGNHWSDASVALALTTDWLMAGGYLSSSDQALARQFLYILARKVGNYGNGYAPSPTAAHNSSALFDYPVSQQANAVGAVRAMGNNYTLSRMLVMAAVGLTFNDTTTDDPALSNTCGASRYQVCSDFTAGSLHAYWSYFSGTMLYLDWAHLEDPTVSWQAYQAAYGNLPTQPACLYTDGTRYPCFGDGRGGESSEGSWYQYSMYRLRYALNLVHTAGYDDPIQYGPQMSLATSSWWDMKYVADLEFLTGPQAGTVPGSQSPAYGYLTTGDSNTYYRMPGDFVTEAAMMTADTYVGRTDRTEALRWLLLNSAYGGPLGTSYGCSSHCGFDSELLNDIGRGLTMDLFLALPAGDPVSSLPADPRPSLPLDLYNGSFNQHVMVRDNWTSPTLFSAYAPNTMINHELQWAGRFDVFANGEYITKGRTVFNDYNYVMSAPTSSNAVAIGNAASGCTSTSCVYGGQFTQGQQAGLIPLQHAEVPSHVSFIVNSTNVYNGGWGYNYPYDSTLYNAVTGASRSLIYLRGSNQVVFYDRASTNMAGNKALYQITTGPLAISGNTASWRTRSGNQQAYFTSLLPAAAAITDAGLISGTVNQPLDWEPYSSLRVNAGTPLSSQFLSVMQWGSSGLAKTPATLVQSTSGQSFDGSLLGSTLVMFMRDWPASFTSVTYPASGATTQYVSDLAPNTTYSISGTGTPASAATDSAGVLTFTAAGSGNITVTTGTAPTQVQATLQSISVSPSVASLPRTLTQQFTATCNYSDSTTSDCSSQLTWSSNLPSIVTVSTSGLATALATGDATLTAAKGSIQGTSSVNVPAPTLQTINVSPGSTTVAPGATQQFKATGVYSDSSTSDLTTQVRWASSNTSVASPNTTGLTTAVAAGTAKITAATGTLQGAATVTVATTASPTFSPAGGAYTSTQSVTISTTTPSATIYYTTDGSAPTTSSTVYNGPISVSKSETVNAIASAAGSSASSVASATYTITLPAANPVFSLAGGTYTSDQTVSISTTTPSATIYYTTDGSNPTTNSATYSGPINVSQSETVKAVAAAAGYSTSGITAASYTIQIAVAAPVFSPAPGRYQGAQTVNISSTTPGAVIHYTTNGTAATASSPVYSGPITVSTSQTLNAIAISNSVGSANTSGTYNISLATAATPVISPGGGKYTAIQQVTISSSSPNSVIYYTTDGSRPTTNSPVYSGTISVDASETIKAMAGGTGYSTSGVVFANYTINLPLLAPTFSPAGGTYTSAQTVTIVSSVPTATIYYTTDGSAPSNNSSVYNGPITVSASETIRAIAYTDKRTKSPEGTATYTISAPTPALAVAVSSSSIRLTAGQTATTNVVLAPTNGFTSPVALSCVGLPAGVSCKFSPANVKVAGEAVTVPLTLVTSPQQASLPAKQHDPFTPAYASVLGLGFIGDKRRRGLRLSAAATLGIFLCTGCGTHVSSPIGAATTADVTVVAAAGSAQPVANFSLTIEQGATPLS